MGAGSSHRGQEFGWRHEKEHGKLPAVPGGAAAAGQRGSADGQPAWGGPGEAWAPGRGASAGLALEAAGAAVDLTALGP